MATPQAITDAVAAYCDRTAEADAVEAAHLAARAARYAAVAEVWRLTGDQKIAAELLGLSQPRVAQMIARHRAAERS